MTKRAIHCSLKNLSPDPRVAIRDVLNQQQPRSHGAAVSRSQKLVLQALANGPMTASELGRTLRSDSASCEAVLSSLVETGFVERDDGLGNQAIYRAMPGTKHGE